jgi:hypothetical protein
MANAMIATGARIDAATLTSTSPIAATLPLGNLLTMQPGEACLFTDPSDIEITIHLAAAAAPTLFALLATNLTGNATWEIWGADSEGALESVGYSFGPASVWTGFGKPSGWDRLPVFHFPAVPASHPWWRIRVDDTGNTDPNGVYVGRAYVDAAWQPPVNVLYGTGLGWRNPSIVNVARGGQLLPMIRPARRVRTFKLGFQTEAQMKRNAFEIDRLRGTTRDIMLVLDPEATEFLHVDTLYGLQIGPDLPPLVIPAFDIYEKSFTLEELVP